MIFVVNADVEINGTLNQYGESGDAEDGVTNSAGLNVIPKSDGQDLIASGISDDGSVITIDRLTISLGDLSLDFGSTVSVSTDVIINSKGFAFRAGDLNGVSNGTRIDLNDTQQTITLTGQVKLIGLPASDPAVIGALWNDSGVVKISAG